MYTGAHTGAHTQVHTGMHRCTYTGVHTGTHTGMGSQGWEGLPPSPHISCHVCITLMGHRKGSDNLRIHGIGEGFVYSDIIKSAKGPGGKKDESGASFS